LNDKEQGRGGQAESREGLTATQTLERTDRGSNASVAPERSPLDDRTAFDRHPSEDAERERRPRRRGRPWWVWLLAAIMLGVAFSFWRTGRPTPVAIVTPQVRSITETIAVSGEVGGKRETVVGVQVQGVVAELRVDEGDVVTRGQVLARVRNDVAEAQVRQAAQALRTARAQLEQAAAGARPSELNAARARVQEAEATRQQREAQLAQAQAAVTQAEARAGLAQTNLRRSRYLFGQGAVARQTVDQSDSAARVAVAEVTAARQGVATAQASLAAGQAAVEAARAQLRTLEEGPRSEAVEVARQHVRDAETALQVAREQAQNAIVKAPFDGTVTQIVAEVGAPVGTGGIVRLVQTGRPEIRVDVDETNLADLRVGQRAIVTSTTFRTARFTARVTEIGAQVDPRRGTVEVTLVPDEPPAWLRPGQTLNVNIVVAENASRLVVPRSAVRPEGDHRIVLVVQDGRAVARPVITGDVEGDVVPILEGLSRDDRVIRDAERVKAGARVHVRGGA
jgi:HlyD family secretion protein